MARRPQSPAMASGLSASSQTFSPPMSPSSATGSASGFPGTAASGSDPHAYHSAASLQPAGGYLGSSDSSSPGGSPLRPTATRRRRDLLKDYYGMADDGGSEAASSATTTTSAGGGGGVGGGGSMPGSNDVSPLSFKMSPLRRADPLDIDTEAYHAELAFNKMTKEMSLQELIRRDNQLVSEIKDLDGNMKTLVYENYSKFIAATDTIRMMKSNAEEMTAKMALLETKISSITAAADDLHSVLAPQRAKIHQLSGVHNLIKKLNFVFELPNRLLECTKKRQFAQAVLFYSKTSALLAHYHHVPAFKQIEDECAGIMFDVGKRVREKMVSDKTSVPQISENVGLMLGLAVMPPLELAKEYIFRVSVQLNKLLDMYSHASSAAMTTDPIDETAATTRVAEFNKVYLAELAAFADCFDAYFLRQRDGSPSNVSPSSIKSIDALKANLFAKNMSDDDRRVARGDLVRVVEDMVNKYFGFIEKMLQLPDDISQVSPTMYVSILQVVRRDIAEAGSLRTIARMETRVAEMRVSILHRIISGVFGKVKQEFSARWREVKVGPDMDVFTIVRQLTSWIKETLIAHALPILENFVRPESTQQMGNVQGVVERIRDTLLAFWTDIGNDMMSATYNETPGSKPMPQHILILSRLALEWSKGSVESVFSMYAERILAADPLQTPMAGSFLPESPTKLASSSGGSGLPRIRGPGGNASPGMIGSGGLTGEAELMIKAQDIAASFKITAQKLLTRYVEVNVAHATGLVRTYAQGLVPYGRSGSGGGGGSDAEPIRQVSRVWMDLAGEFDRMHADVKKCFDDDAGGDPRRRSMDLSKRMKTTNVTPGMKSAGSAMFVSPSTAASLGVPGMSGGGGGGGGLGSGAAGLARHSSLRHAATSQTTLPSLGSTMRSNPPSSNASTIIGSGGNAGLGIGGGAGQFDALLNDIDRLFQERIEYLPSRIELSRAAVLLVMTKVTLKCFIEHIRDMVLSTTAYQQIQVDVAYIRAQFWSFVGDERLLGSMLDTALQNAFQRCVDPVGMDSLAIDRLVSVYVK
ncbi:hypothetical protein BC831DRAFT_476199 [Entophlyctis helioformis]|nr:hypothetical protein BC831DRAFT_476199 [Entophlyctis helioformis]